MFSCPSIKQPTSFLISFTFLPFGLLASIYSLWLLSPSFFFPSPPTPQNAPYDHDNGCYQVLGANCEVVVGYVPLPCGVVGPLKINGTDR
jgi:hypothetical protein